MRSKSITHETGALHFGGPIDRVGAAVALAMWDALRSSTGDVPTFRDWVNQYLDPDSGRLTGHRARHARRLQIYRQSFSGGYRV
jgi:hypothetical protein